MTSPNMYHWIVSMSYTTGATSGAGTAYYSGTHETSGFAGFVL